MAKEKEQFLFNKQEEGLKKESLREEYNRLMKELAEMNQELNEQQKEFSGDDVPTADFYANRALVEHKHKRIKEIEELLRKEK